MRRGVVRKWRQRELLAVLARFRRLLQRRHKLAGIVRKWAQLQASKAFHHMVLLQARRQEHRALAARVPEKFLEWLCRRVSRAD